MSNTPSETEIDNLLCKHWPGYSRQAVLVKMWLREAIESAIAKWAAPQQEPAVEREQERIAFKDAHRHLDLDEVPDAWGRPMFKHSHVEASWLGWIARASHGQAPATQQAGLALSDDLRDRLVAISEAVADQDDRAAQAMLREILKAPQPSPTAQTDSVPAIQGEMNVQLDIDSNHSAPGQQRDVARSVALGQPMGNGQDQAAGRPSAQGDKLLTVAERNIRSFLRSAQFKSESDREAALSCVDVLWEAARASADSVKEDAARYRWLRATTNYVTSNGERIDVRNMPEKWDAAIDAALAAQGGKV